MNSILSTQSNNNLTPNEMQFFKEAENIVKENNDFYNNKNSFKNKFLLIIVLIIVILVLLFCSIFSLLNINNTKILKNVSVIGVDISNLTKDEAKEKLTSAFSPRLNDDIVLTHNDESYVLEPATCDFSFDIDDIVNEAYMVGRNGNFIQNNFSILKQKFSKYNITPKLSYNNDTLVATLEQTNSLFKDGIKEYSYEIDGKNLNITAGKDGYVLKTDELKKKINDNLVSENYSTNAIEIPVEMGKCKDIDIDAIHGEIYKEAKNASFTINPYHIESCETGIDFDISIKKKKKMISEKKDSYTIPLKYLYPTVTNDQIAQEAFPDTLASYSTSYTSSNANRSNNVELATRKINGTVLMPGETFSYNNTVGKRTVSAGFREAGAYSAGQVVTEVGGGICQVSSTLYNAVLRANLEIVARSNHHYQVGYVPVGTDATVSWGAPDFKFKNNRNYAIRINAYTSNKHVYIKIQGLKQDDDYEISITSKVNSTIAPSITYTTDASLKKGQTKVIQKGSSGAYSTTYKIYKKNGTTVKTEVISNDKYYPHNQVVAVGK